MKSFHQNLTQRSLSRYLFVTLFALVSAHATANTINFSQYPDGTLASGPNPYAGVLNIQAQSQTVTFNGQVSVILTEASVTGGVLAIVPPFSPIGIDYLSQMNATFLQPATQVSFSVFAWRFGGYQYFGVNGNGDQFTGSGITDSFFEGSLGAFQYQTINLDLPAGYWLTSFKVSNRDPKNLDGALWIRDISFTAPESTNTLALLLLTCGGLFLATRCSALSQRRGANLIGGFSSR